MPDRSRRRGVPGAARQDRRRRGSAGLARAVRYPVRGLRHRMLGDCMDKSLAYVVARSAGIATPEFRVLNGADTVAPTTLAYPVFVKPARSGSSFGVTKVECADELHVALAAARRYDSKVLIEQAVVGTEVGCAVLGNGSDLIVGEPSTRSRCRTASSASTKKRRRSRAPRTRSSPCRRSCPTAHPRRDSRRRRRPSTRPSAARVSPASTCSCRPTDGSSSTR